jgi:hypothetical protein
MILPDNERTHCPAPVGRAIFLCAYFPRHFILPISEIDCLIRKVIVFLKASAGERRLHNVKFCEKLGHYV